MATWTISTKNHLTRPENANSMAEFRSPKAERKQNARKMAAGFRPNPGLRLRLGRRLAGPGTGERWFEMLAYEVAIKSTYCPSPPERNAEYLRFVRGFPCAVCARTLGIEACHTGPHGI